MNLKDVLRGTLTAAQLTHVRTSFDSVGDIAILEIPRELVKKQKTIAQTFLRAYPNFKVVAKKSGGHEGKYRVQRVTVLAGEKRTLTEHKESGVRVRVDVNTSYFSPRLSTERLRIASLVKKGERVLVLFSGVGPYALVIARHSKAAHVTAVELNPAAHRLAVENVRLNKLESTITPVRANAKAWCLKTKEKFNRIIMPLPMTANQFLPAALKVAKKGATIHCYAFAHEDAFQEAADTVLNTCRKAKKSCVVERVVKVGQQKPHVYRVSVDARVR
jgi:tRNA (guanine37-N1)-methyltransferase